MARQRGKSALNGIRALVNFLPLLAQGAMEETMRVAEEEAQRTTVFRNYTGRLRKSIRAGIVSKSMTHIVGALTAGTDDAQSKAGWETPSREYSRYVELGTTARPPKPFIMTTMRSVASRNILPQGLQRRLISMMRSGTW